MKRKKLSGLGLKIAYIGAAVIIALAILNGALIYYTANTGTERAIANFSMDTAKNIADHIDADDYKQFLKAQEENDHYWKMREDLDDYRVKSGVLYAYTLNVTDSKDVEILLEGQPEGSEDASEIGEIIEVTTYDHVAPVLEGKTSFSDIVKDPLYGDYLSAFAPIKDEDGNVIGILGVDIAADQVGAITKNVMMSVLPILVPSIILFIVFAVAGLFFFIMRTLRPLMDVETIADMVANGDIRTAQTKAVDLPIHRKDEIGELSQSFQHMVVQLEEMIKQIQSTSEQVAASSEELYASAVQSVQSNEQIRTIIGEVETGSQNQLASSEEGVRGMEEMAEGSQQIAEAALTAADNAANTLEEADNGKIAVDKILSQMNLIGQVTEDSSVIIHRLDDHSGKIVNILKVITDIAEQTNLLALNAAIEAARAGEHGKGFAVVADEIRHLADQSKHSVGEISGLVSTIQQDMALAVDSMNTGGHETEKGLEIAQDTENAFQHILDNMEEVVRNIQDVSASSEEMAAGSEEVTALITEMENIAKLAATNTKQVVGDTEGQLTTMEEISNASEGLSKIAQELQDTIQTFKV